MIPEEFPVILTVFMSMGAWRLAKKNSLVRKLPSVETLGAVSVLCVDKTGTITLNQMTVQDERTANGNEDNLVEIMGLACETDAYDPMEKAMLAHCEEQHGIRYALLPTPSLYTHFLYSLYLFLSLVKGCPSVVIYVKSINLSNRLQLLTSFYSNSIRGTAKQ